MSDFLLKVAEKLKEKGSSLKIDCASTGVTAEWMKKEEEDFVWNGHAEIPQNIFEKYPYLQKIMMDYQADLDVALQSFTNLYWVCIKSFSHPVVYVTDVNLLVAFAKLNEKIEQEYQDVLKIFKEKIQKYGEENKQMLIEGSCGNYFVSDLREDGKTFQKVLGSNVNILLSSSSNIKELLQKKQECLALRYEPATCLYVSSVFFKENNNPFMTYDEELLKSIQKLDGELLERKLK